MSPEELREPNALMNGDMTLTTDAISVPSITGIRYLALECFGQSFLLEDLVANASEPELGIVVESFARLQQEHVELYEG